MEESPLVGKCNRVERGLTAGIFALVPRAFESVRRVGGRAFSRLKRRAPAIVAMVAIIVVPLLAESDDNSSLTPVFVGARSIASCGQAAYMVQLDSGLLVKRWTGGGWTETTVTREIGGQSICSSDGQLLYFEGRHSSVIYTWSVNRWAAVERPREEGRPSQSVFAASNAIISISSHVDLTEPILILNSYSGSNRAEPITYRVHVTEIFDFARNVDPAVTSMDVDQHGEGGVRTAIEIRNVLLTKRYLVLVFSLGDSRRSWLASKEIDNEHWNVVSLPYSAMADNIGISGESDIIVPVVSTAELFSDSSFVPIDVYRCGLVPKSGCSAVRSNSSGSVEEVVWADGETFLAYRNFEHCFVVLNESKVGPCVSVSSQFLGLPIFFSAIGSQAVLGLSSFSGRDEDKPHISVFELAIKP